MAKEIARGVRGQENTDDVIHIVPSPESRLARAVEELSDVLDTIIEHISYRDD